MGVQTKSPDRLTVEVDHRVARGVSMVPQADLEPGAVGDGEEVKPSRVKGEMGEPSTRNREFEAVIRVGLQIRGGG